MLDLLPVLDEFDGGIHISPYLAIAFEQHFPTAQTPCAHFDPEMAACDHEGDC